MDTTFHNTRQVKRGIKTKSEKVEKKKQVLSELQEQVELTEHGWETIPS